MDAGVHCSITPRVEPFSLTSPLPNRFGLQICNAAVLVRVNTGAARSLQGRLTRRSTHIGPMSTGRKVFWLCYIFVRFAAFVKGQVYVDTARAHTSFTAIHAVVRLQNYKKYCIQ